MPTADDSSSQNFSLVGQHWLKAAIRAMALGVGLYVVPMGMISHPSLIAWWDYPLNAELSMAQMATGLAVLSLAFITP